MPRGWPKGKRRKPGIVGAARLLDDGTFEVTLVPGVVTFVDADMLPMLLENRWGVLENASGGRYLYRSIRTGDSKRNEYFHHLVIPREGGLWRDHANRNPLDNRRSNLRLATPSQNGSNRASPPNRTGFRGVSKVSRGLKFRAYIGAHDGRQTHLGCYWTAEEAARAYDAAAILEYGDFAQLNFGHSPAPFVSDRRPDLIGAT